METLYSGFLIDAMIVLYKKNLDDVYFRSHKDGHCLFIYIDKHSGNILFVFDGDTIYNKPLDEFDIESTEEIDKKIEETLNGRAIGTT